MCVRLLSQKRDGGEGKKKKIKREQEREREKEGMKVVAKLERSLGG